MEQKLEVDHPKAREIPEKIKSEEIEKMEQKL